MNEVHWTNSRPSDESVQKMPRYRSKTSIRSFDAAPMARGEDGVNNNELIAGRFYWVIPRVRS